MKKILFGLIALIGLGFSFSSASNFEGFQTIYSQNFNSSNYSSISSSNSDNLLTKSSLGIYCSEIKVNSIDSFSSSDYNQLLTSRFQRDYDSNYRNDDTIISMYTFSHIADFNYSFINCTSLNQNNGYIFIKFYSSNATKLQQLFETYNLNLSFNVYYYTGYDLLSSSCASSSCDYSDYVPVSDYNSCQSSLSSCQSSLSGYVNTLDNISNNLNTCNSSLSACLQSNCPEVEVPDVSWSSFWINNTQIQGASNIYLYMPDFLSWNYTYLNSGATLQIDVDNEGDEDYINGLLSIETYHPTSDEFAVSFVGYLTLLMPYIIITLFIVFVWKLIKKIFR